MPAHRRRHGELGRGRRGVRGVGAVGSDAVGGRSAVSGVLPAGLRGHGDADAGPTQARPHRVPTGRADLRADAGRTGRGDCDRPHRRGAAGRTRGRDGRARIPRRRPVVVGAHGRHAADPWLAGRTAVGSHDRRLHGVCGRRHRLSLPVDGGHVPRGHVGRRVLADRGATASRSRVGCHPPAPPRVRNPVLQLMFRPLCVVGSRSQWP